MADWAPRRVVMLSVYKSGSTFALRKLATHPKVHQIDEVLMRKAQECKGDAEYGCGWDELIARTEEGYRKGAQVLREKVRQAGMLDEEEVDLRDYMLVQKVQYGFWPLALSEDFAHYCHCNDIAVIHFYRDATISTFWTLQAEMVDFVGATLGGGKAEIRKRPGDTSEVKSAGRSLPLDVAKAAQFVDAMESQRDRYRLLFELYPRHLRYYELKYEALTGPYADSYWDGVLAWLGFRDSSAVLEDKLQRIHKGACVDKIANWEEVKGALGPHSTSSYACEMGYFDKDDD